MWGGNSRADERKNEQSHDKVAHVHPPQLPSSWHSKRLSVTDSTVAELDDLQTIYDACAYIGEWCGPDTTIKGTEMRDALAHKNLPPHGKKNAHRVQTIRTENETIIGYLLLYHGFPDTRTFWIATLAIHPVHQKKQYGKEVIEGLTHEIQILKKYAYIGGCVGIKNWPALRFWIQNGFNKILKFDGDTTYAADAFAELWLVKEIA